MLVKDIMTRHPILISPDTLAAEAQRIMAENNIRHLPVVGDGKRLKGLITRQVLALKPDFLGSLNVWEISRFLSNLKVKDVMIKDKDVITIDGDRTVERAARILTENKIGCLPVVEDGVVVGIITEVDLLNSYQIMLGLPVNGVRVTVRMPNVKGEFARMMAAFREHKMGVMGIGVYPSPRLEGYYDAVIKIPNASVQQVQEVVASIEGQQLIDVREIV